MILEVLEKNTSGKAGARLADLMSRLKSVHCMNRNLQYNTVLGSTGQYLRQSHHSSRQDQTDSVTHVPFAMALILVQSDPL